MLKFYLFTGLPQMDGKEVEDLFKGVLTDDVAESLAAGNFFLNLF